ncbi:pentatricopeptide repeat-containing protein At3g50420-like isoform X2 [Amaranthus tricolor]|uniref:pentatricopeptide repeat-containing protein At3g50420-like isoform X2 n=1 Tax=Amaranthus tricolor TaxID=29722 RepID=UPI00258480E0|nr:pentatricopeptide repeat-containing protein At3g50420-like isoform X2 [Amaranthus tricolor]
MKFFSFSLSLLHKCISITSLKKAHKLHALILTSSTPFTYYNPFLHNIILSMYAKCGSARHAYKVFDKMPQRNFISYNSIISAYARQPYAGAANYAFDLFFQMRFQGFTPNGATFISLLQSACVADDLLRGLALHCLIIKFGQLFDVQVQTALIRFFSYAGDLSSVDEVFGDVIVKDDYSWNCVISGYLKNERLAKGLCLFRKMLRSDANPTEFTYSIVLNACAKFGIQNPDLVSWNTMMAGYAEKGEGEKAMDLFVQLQHCSTQQADEYTFASLISAIQEYPASHYGEPLHAKVILYGLDNSVFVGSPLLSMYFGNGKIESAEAVFHLIPRKDIVLWTEMISGYSKVGYSENAIEFFYNMWKGGHKVDDFALSSALSACAELVTLRQGEMLHSLAVKTGCGSMMSVCGSLINLYAKNGDLQAAKSIFSEVKAPDLKCLNSMIGAYSHHGMAEEAIRLFHRFLVSGLQLDDVTFISLLSACSHCGLVDRAKQLWNYMKDKGLSPGLEHYACMVSLLSRAGLLEEAVEIINKSNLSKNRVALWRTVLSAAVSCKNLSMGLDAAREILQLNEQDSATHTLLSNLYASVGSWDDVLEVRKRIRGLMLEKDPGLSWVETVKSLEVFSSGDHSHPKIEEVKDQLHILQENMMLWQDVDI